MHFRIPGTVNSSVWHLVEKTTMSPPRRNTEQNTPALSHLWRGANSLLATAPAVAGHLASVLLYSAANGAGHLAQRLQCSHCGALLTNARVRVHGERERARRAENIAKVVVRTCPLCERHDTVVTKTRVEAAKDRIDLKEAAKKARQEAKKKAKNQRKRPLQTPTLETRQKKKSKRKSRNSSSSVIVRTPAKRPGPAQSAQNGLRTKSFLFDPLD